MAEGDTLVNAVIGAVATAVLSMILPFAPVFGGAVAGYLQGGDRSEGLRIGAISGGIAFIPAVLIAGVALLFIIPFFLGFGADGALGFGLFGGIFVLFVLVGVAAYIIGLSVFGGWIGNYVKYDTDVDF